jgi:hypothetical protein
MVTKEHVLAEIRRTAAGNGGRALGKARFAAETGIREADWSGRYWARWNDALADAGFEPNEMQDSFPVGHVVASLALFIHELGRFPTVPELKMKRRDDSSFPSHNTIAKLGSKAVRARRVLDYCSERDDLEDVAAICAPLAEAAVDRVDNGDVVPSGDEPFGFVYLMKSGRYYKLGRSVCAEKRTYEVQLVLPEEVKLIHKIKTDDPVGIEAYWHARFADRRLRGEWFDLSAQDVSSFRRRTFM